MPLDAVRDALIAVQGRVIEVLAAENAGLAGQVTDLGCQGEAAGAARLTQQRQLLDAAVG